MSMNFKAGDELTPFVIESVSPDAMRDWSVFLADPNPIHLDVEVVKAKGLGDKRINQGPINVAYMMNMLMATIHFIPLHYTHVISNSEFEVQLHIRNSESLDFDGELRIRSSSF